MKNLLILLLLCAGLSVQAKKPLTADPKASKETVKLYQRLQKLQQKGTMFGHQDDLPYGNDWYDQPGRSDVKEVCGDYPAIFGWELGHLELGNAYNLDSVNFEKVIVWIREMNRKGAIQTISWHLRNPLTGGTAWDVSNKRTVASILPGGPKNELYRQYMDKLATFLLSLKDDKGHYIPVIFRPFHEHTGSWFWWGKDLCTPEEYKSLWRYTATYLRDTKNIHHLLYTYSTGTVNSVEDYMERYPGDDLIDMVAFDAYDYGGNFAASLQKNCEIVTTVAAQKNKIPAVSETGANLVKNPDWWTRTLLEVIRPFHMSYALVWRNAFNNKKEIPYAPYKGSPDEQDFLKFYNDPKTLFLKDIQ
ncbi:MAG TPA: glycosyl hydrolase [Prolixibacteraceae bacterium]|nr:glycosyl hydrolase [Prolixibacteraceae bacterium]